MYPSHQRLQLREFKDFQPLSLLLTDLGSVDAHTRREFANVVGPVWQRFNAATRGASHRRVTAIFLSDAMNRFEGLLFVACDCVRRRERRSFTLWAAHPELEETLGLADVVCQDLAGRSMLTYGCLVARVAALAGHVGEPPRRPRVGDTGPSLTRP